MHPFRYLRATDETSATQAGREAGAQFLAGGTTLVDLLRLEVIGPKTLVDINLLPLSAIEARDGGVRIGAMARNSEVAHHPLIRERFPVLSEALLSGASPQLRNMATVGGNLLQRTRCAYFRDLAAPCNKRNPGAGCAALEGYTRMHAVLGGSERCIAAHPSDMCVALLALDAVVGVRGAGGAREIPVGDFHTLPGDHPEVESVLQPGELVLYVHLPARPFSARSRYVKVRDRASYAFALASAAVALDLSPGDGGQGVTIREARVVLGGVATKPWRSPAAEQALAGKAPAVAAFRAAAELALQGAEGRRDNRFKIELARRTLVRALSLAGGIT